MAGLFDKLRQRHVLRAAAAYGVVAWLVIQIADTVFPILGVPSWVTTMVVVLMITGFPVTIVVSWFYRLTPTGFVTEVDSAAVGNADTGRLLDFVIIILLCIAVGWLVYDRTRGPAPLDNSIAVLPFVNMTDDPGYEYFSDGMSEEILNLLAGTPELKVIGRASSFAFKGTGEDIRTIGQALGVESILDGSVRMSGDRVRVTAQLISVSDGSTRWAQSFDRTLEDVFAVQDDVAAAIIDSLQIHVGAKPERGRPTESPEAYSLFLKARVLLNAQNGREAIEALRQATRIDPDFAEAFELLAYSYWQQSGAGLGAEEGFSLGRDAAEKALAIDPDRQFAEAVYFLTRGAAYQVQAIEALERLRREGSGDVALLRPLIYQLSFAGYLGEAYHLAEEYVDVDPLAPVANYSLGEMLHANGRTAEAMVPLMFAYDLRNLFASWFVPSVNLIRGLDELAVSQLEADLSLNGVADTSWLKDLVGEARQSNDRNAFLDRRYDEILAGIPNAQARVVRYTLTTLYLVFGLTDAYFERILEAGPNMLAATDADILLWQGMVLKPGAITSHPRYPEIAEALGLVRVWEHRGPPDHCRQEAEQWVCGRTNAATP